MEEMYCLERKLPLRARLLFYFLQATNKDIFHQVVSEKCRCIDIIGYHGSSIILYCANVAFLHERKYFRNWTLRTYL